MACAAKQPEIGKVRVWAALRAGQTFIATHVCNWPYEHPKYRCHSSIHFKQLLCPRYSQYCREIVEDVCFSFLSYLGSIKYFQKLSTKYMCGFVIISGTVNLAGSPRSNLFFANSLFYINLYID